MRPARSPSGTTAPTLPSACRKLDTMPCAESVRVPSRSKITNCGRAATVLRRVSVTTPLLPTSTVVPVAGLAGDYCRAVASQSRAAARYHGAQAAVPGMLDFAVNVRASEPPSWLVDRLAARMADL